MVSITFRQLQHQPISNTQGASPAAHVKGFGEEVTKREEVTRRREEEKEGNSTNANTQHNQATKQANINTNTNTQDQHAHQGKRQELQVQGFSRRGHEYEHALWEFRGHRRENVHGFGHGFRHGFLHKG